MNTSSMRQNSGCAKVIGVPMAVLGVLLLIGAASMFDPQATAGTDTGVRVAYHLAGPMVLGLLGLLCFLPLIHGIDLGRTADRVERDAAQMDEEWHPGPDGVLVPGRLRHYDSGRGKIWDEWADRHGYHQRVVRKMTPGEIRELEIQNGDGGGYGKINYGGE